MFDPVFRVDLKMVENGEFITDYRVKAVGRQPYFALIALFLQSSLVWYLTGT